VSVIQVNQVDRVFVPTYHIRELLELIWEKRFQVCNVGTKPRLFDPNWLFGFATKPTTSVHNKSAALVPDRHQKLALADLADLSDVFAWQNLFVAEVQLVSLAVKSPKEQTVTTAESKGLPSVRLDDLVYVGLEGSDLL
jgi:hypothetical protein